MVRRPRSFALLLVAAGVLAMANPLYLPVGADYTDGARYVHRVEPVGDAALPADATYRYGNLSADARRAFDRALAAPDGRYVAADAAAAAPEFAYPPADPVPGEGVYAVRYEGGVYRLTTTWDHVGVGPGLLLQRTVLMPALFLGGFFALVAAAAVAWPDRDPA